MVMCAVGLLLAGCAQMANPTGGAKDTNPPALLRASPADQSLLFSAMVIRFDFDEYLTLNDIQNELIISPPLRTKPEVLLKKKSVLVKLKEPLRDSTTYTFNFGQAIGDLNENNRIPNFAYVVSTGRVIDSLAVFGTVRDAFSGLPAEGVKVMLYDTDADSLPLTTLPYYFGRTDKVGAFSIHNMRSGSYKVFALKEDLTDYLFNSPEESIGFSPMAAVPTTVQDSAAVPLRLLLFNEGKTKPYVKDTRSDSTGRMAIAMSAGKATDYRVVAMGNFALQAEYTDSIHVWADVPMGKGTYKAVVMRDTVSIDTLTLRLSQKPKSIKTEGAKSGKNTGQDSLIVRCDRPVKSVDATRILLLMDKDTLPAGTALSAQRPREIKLTAPLTPGKSYKAIFLPGAISTQADGQNTDTLRVNISIHPPDFYGKISFGLAVEDAENLKGKAILRIEDSTGDTVFESPSGPVQTFDLPKVAPGRYTVLLIEDANQNGRWDTGDYALGLQPERVFRLSETIEVRSDWEQSLRWELRVGQ